uniref:Uncharacterized protein n=1 Tax=Hemiselmis andersenii TaxID=464988 RepID=A0A6U4UZ16_HEMAN|mmetsp:Transcript_42545/g.98996  ORF Transcript_42545/g.98996 Transcript_42545/m.98996 type:complete len:140 (+) Transcript_42545:228-647(+)
MRRAIISRFRRSKSDKEEAPREPASAQGRRSGLSGYPGIGVVDFSLTTTKPIPSRPAAATAESNVAKRGSTRYAWDERKDEVIVTELRLSKNKPPVAIIMQEEVDEESHMLRKSRSMRSSRGLSRAQSGDGGLSATPSS